MYRILMLLLLVPLVALAADLPQPVGAYLRYTNKTYKMELSHVRGGFPADPSSLDPEIAQRALDRALAATGDEGVRKSLAAHFVRWNQCRQTLAAGAFEGYDAYAGRLNSCEASLDEKSAEIEAGALALR